MKIPDHPRWGKTYAASTPYPEGEPLSHDEVMSLEPETIVVIRFGGGNGPHVYKIIEVNEVKYLISKSEDEELARRHRQTWGDSLDSLIMGRFGTERWQNKCWVVDKELWDAEDE